MFTDEVTKACLREDQTEHNLTQGNPLTEMCSSPFLLFPGHCLFLRVTTHCLSFKRLSDDVLGRSPANHWSQSKRL